MKVDDENLDNNQIVIKVDLNDYNDYEVIEKIVNVIKLEVEKVVVINEAL